MPKPEDVIGPAAVKALQDAGYTLVPPKEPARLVRMEESGGRYERGFPGWKFLECVRSVREENNAADNWLVKTVNKRIVDTILPVTGQFCSVNREYLLRLFCGEEK